ncbi:DUF1653 domain-containing protein [Roseobacter sp.]|uniref:DUF1653 domain-containing protein n=1 Tax=Roseobacter sp. TaxID=1907202 RepID=UPI003299F559
MTQNSKIWQHKKTGGLYRIITPDARIEATLECAVVYESLADGAIWVRPKSEFYDGRFCNLSGEDVVSRQG